MELKLRKTPINIIELHISLISYNSHLNRLISKPIFYFHTCHLFKFQFIYLPLYTRCVFKVYLLLNVQTLCIFLCFLLYKPKQEKEAKGTCREDVADSGRNLRKQSVREQLRQIQEQCNPTLRTYRYRVTGLIYRITVNYY